MDFPDRLAPDKAENLLTKRNKRLWPDTTELIGLEFELEAIAEGVLDTAYARGLHAWLLDQMRQIAPDLAKRMHDRPDDKGFTISRLRGGLVETDQGFWVRQGETLYWSVSGLDLQVVEGLHQLLKSGVRVLDQRVMQLRLRACRVELPATTYRELMAGALSHQVTLSFLSATGFRRKKQHFPLPVPFNAFQSYLRRWEALSGEDVEREAFLEWVDNSVIVQRHQVESCLVAAGKRGVLTGYIGGVTFAVTREGMEELDFVHLFGTLGRFAAYCGTGHKTAFGLGQTREGWLLMEGERVVMNAAQVLEERIALLREVFYGQRKRQGGQRAERTAEVWATVLARRELGEPVKEIAEDMGLRYETAKTYVKLARRALREGAG